MRPILLFIGYVMYRFFFDLFTYPRLFLLDYFRPADHVPAVEYEWLETAPFTSILAAAATVAGTVLIAIGTATYQQLGPAVLLAGLLIYFGVGLYIVLRSVYHIVVATNDDQMKQSIA